jgi:hypothetical protein
LPVQGSHDSGVPVIVKGIEFLSKVYFSWFQGVVIWV